MKFTINGFSQEKLIEYGLDSVDALILRYFIDFKDSGDMLIVTVQDKPYYWLKYDNLIDNIPIIPIKSKDALRRRLKKLEDSKVLEHHHKQNGGSYSFYGIGENYKYLIKSEDVTEKSEGYDSKVGGYDSKVGGYDSRVGGYDSKVASLRLKSSTPTTEKSEGTIRESEGTIQKSEGTIQKSGGYDSKVGGYDSKVAPLRLKSSTPTTQKSEQKINLLKDSSIKDKNIYTTQFLEWFEIYPNGFNKEQSFKSFNKLLKTETFENIMAATKHYIAYLKQNVTTDKRYVVRSTNFIGQKKEYLGYLEMAVNTGQSTPTVNTGKVKRSIDTLKDMDLDG